jgi:hypothetical protein
LKNIVDCNNDDIRAILPNCRNIDAEVDDDSYEPENLQDVLDRIEEEDEETDTYCDDSRR